MKIHLFLKKYARYYAFSAILLAAGVLSGLFLPMELKYRFIQMFSDKIRDMGEINVLTLFLNNLQASVIIAVSGVLVVFPFIILFTNGLVIGAAASVMAGIAGAGPVALSLAPHGVFELTAFTLAGGTGIILAMKVVRRLRDLAWRDFAANTGKVFALLVLPGLVLAAALEHTVSRQISEKTMRMTEAPDLKSLKSVLYAGGYTNRGGSVNPDISSLYAPVRERMFRGKGRMPLFLGYTNRKTGGAFFLLATTNTNGLPLENSAVGGGTDDSILFNPQSGTLAEIVSRPADSGALIIFHAAGYRKKLALRKDKKE